MTTTLPEPCGPDCRGMSPYHEEPCPKCGKWTERRVEVVSAVILRQGRILLQQRSPSRDYPLTWECPGGKVEWSDALRSYEPPRHALIRELGEELGWGYGPVSSGTIELQPFFQTTFEPPEVPKPFKLTFFLVYPAEDWQPKMLDAAGLGWFTLYEMASMRLTPGNVKLFQGILRAGFSKLAGDV